MEQRPNTIFDLLKSSVIVGSGELYTYLYAHQQKGISLWINELKVCERLYLNSDYHELKNHADILEHLKEAIEEVSQISTPAHITHKVIQHLQKAVTFLQVEDFKHTSFNSHVVDQLCTRFREPIFLFEQTLIERIAGKTGGAEQFKLVEYINHALQFLGYSGGFVFDIDRAVLQFKTFYQSYTNFVRISKKEKKNNSIIDEIIVAPSIQQVTQSFEFFQKIPAPQSIESQYRHVIKQAKQIVAHPEVARLFLLSKHPNKYSLLHEIILKPLLDQMKALSQWDVFQDQYQGFRENLEDYTDEQFVRMLEHYNQFRQQLLIMQPILEGRSFNLNTIVSKFRKVSARESIHSQYYQLQENLNAFTKNESWVLFLIKYHCALDLDHLKHLRENLLDLQAILPQKNFTNDPWMRGVQACQYEVFEKKLTQISMDFSKSKELILKKLNQTYSDLGTFQSSNALQQKIGNWLNTQIPSLNEDLEHHHFENVEQSFKQKEALLYMLQHQFQETYIENHLWSLRLFVNSEKNLEQKVFQYLENKTALYQKATFDFMTIENLAIPSQKEFSLVRSSWEYRFFEFVHWLVHDIQQSLSTRITLPSLPQRQSDYQGVQKFLIQLTLTMEEEDRYLLLPFLEGSESALWQSSSFVCSSPKSLAQTISSFLAKMGHDSKPP